MIKEEIWRDIKGYEGSYQVSDIGRVKSLERIITRTNGYAQKIHGRIMKQSINTHGYPSISLWVNNKGKGHRIHRLMAEAFIPKIEGKNLVNHKDGIKSRNILDNLEWASYTDNLNHAFMLKMNPTSKHIKVTDLETKEESSFKSMATASLFIGKSRAYISCLTKNFNKYKNKEYKWELI